MGTARRSPQEIIVDRLAELLGPNTARVAVKVFTERATGHATGPLTPEEQARVLEALRPMLRTLLGTRRAEELVLTLARELS